MECFVVGQSYFVAPVVLDRSMVNAQATIHTRAIRKTPVPTPENIPVIMTVPLLPRLSFNYTLLGRFCSQVMVITLLNNFKEHVR